MNLGESETGSVVESELNKLQKIIDTLKTENIALNGDIETFKQQEIMFHQLLDNARHGMYIQDVPTITMLYVNPACAEMFGSSQEEMTTNPESWSKPIYPEDLQRIRENSRKITDQQDWDFLEDDYRIVKPDGTLRWARDVTVPIRDDQGKLIRITGVIKDITKQKQAEDNLREWTKKIELLHEVTRQMAVHETEELVYLLTIEAVDKILGLSQCHISSIGDGKLVKKAVTTGIQPIEPLFLNVDPATIRKLIEKKATLMIDSTMPGWNPAYEKHGYKTLVQTPIGTIGIFQAVSKRNAPSNPSLLRMLELLLGHTYEAINRIRLQENLKQQALHDPLTGVFNRYYLNIYLRQEMKRSERYNRKIGFVMIDIDRFKEINDRFGHMVGDKVLAEIATEIQQCVRESDIVIRYGGDEFLAILPETNGEVKFARKRISENVPDNKTIQKLVGFPVTISMGTAYWEPGGSVSLETILAQSDAAMYEAKRKKQV